MPGSAETLGVSSNLVVVVFFSGNLSCLYLALDFAPLFLDPPDLRMQTASSHGMRMVRFRWETPSPACGRLILPAGVSSPRASKPGID